MWFDQDSSCCGKLKAQGNTHASQCSCARGAPCCQQAAQDGVNRGRYLEPKSGECRIGGPHTPRHKHRHKTPLSVTLLVISQSGERCDRPGCVQSSPRVQEAPLVQLQLVGENGPPERSNFAVRSRASHNLEFVVLLLLLLPPRFFAGGRIPNAVT